MSDNNFNSKNENSFSDQIKDSVQRFKDKKAEEEFKKELLKRGYITGETAVECDNCGAMVKGEMGTTVKCSYCDSPVRIDYQKIENFYTEVEQKNNSPAEVVVKEKKSAGESLSDFGKGLADIGSGLNDVNSEIRDFDRNIRNTTHSATSGCIRGCLSGCLPGCLISVIVPAAIIATVFIAFLT